MIFNNRTRKRFLKSKEAAKKAAKKAEAEKAREEREERAKLIREEREAMIEAKEIMLENLKVLNQSMDLRSQRISRLTGIPIGTLEYWKKKDWRIVKD